MATIADLVVNVGADTSGLSKVGKQLSTFVTAPLLGLGVAATNAASNLNESMNAVETVFGPAADAIQNFGETAADTVGLSQRAFNELVTPVGAALQNVGFSADEAADASINLAKRAADMASVFNVDVSDALGAIQAGLRGEADPLERFGVGMNAAAVQAKAMELGLADATNALTEQDKAQARLALLMEQTNKIAGDRARTAGEVANQERSAAAAAEDMAAALGQDLLPIKAQLIAMVRRVIAAFNGLSPEMQRNILAFAGVAAAIGPLLVVANSAIKTVRSLAGAFTFVGKNFNTMFKLLKKNPWIAIITAVLALVIVIVKNWDKIKAFVTNAVNRIKAVVSRVWNSIKSTTLSVWNSVLGFFRRLPGNILSFIRGLAGTVFRFIVKWHPLAVLFRLARRFAPQLFRFVKSIPGRIVSALGNLGSLLFQAGKNVVQGLIDGIMNMIGSVGRAIGSVASKIRGFLPFSPAEEGPLRRHPMDEAGRNIGMMLAGGMGDAERAVVAAAEDIARSAVVDPLSNIATPRGVSRAQRAPLVLELRGDGSGRADFLIEELRGAIRERGGADLVLGGESV